MCQPRAVAPERGQTGKAILTREGSWVFLLTVELEAGPGSPSRG